MTEQPGVASICAVVVTYRPDRDALNELLAALSGQAGAVVVVDNTGGDPRRVVDGLAGVDEVLHQDGNVGLAAAQNLGYAWARSRGYPYALTLDQDSLPGEGMVVSLLEALTRLGAMGQVAAVGPRFHDLREDRDAPFVRIAFPFNRKLWCHRPDQVLATDFLISSGMLVPLAVLDAVGDMDADLFIDNVDLEWCFRARDRGYALFGVCAATMHHRLGDSRQTLPFGLGTVVVHGPPRLYYIMRNRVLLYRMRHTPRVWVAQDLPRLLVKLLLFGVLIGPRGRNLRFMLRGLWDGVHGRRGRCRIDTAD